jgi:DNA gyrase/topoisomerase IV subunit A
MPQYIYKIRNPDGLFSTGGEVPTFTAKGKVWRARGHITSHLVFARNLYPKGTEVVRYQVYEEADALTDVADWEESARTTQARNRQLTRQIEREREKAQAEADRLAKKLAELNKKLGQ